MAKVGHRTVIAQWFGAGSISPCSATTVSWHGGSVIQWNFDD